MAYYNLLFAFIIDMAVGDPPKLPHPVRLIGALVNRLERWLQGIFRRPAGKRAAGVILLLTVVFITGFATFSLIHFTSGVLSAVFVIYISYTTIAARSLAGAARKMHETLCNGDLASSRRELAMIVGRDTGSLSQEDIIRATLETVSENISDAIIAPLFYLVLGGPVAAMVYKSVNTLDSMVGYKTERFREIGWASAKADDLLNIVPARISAILISISFLAFDNSRAALDSLKTALRDGSKSPSPNAGYPEAAMAGGLGVAFGGDDLQYGRLRRKPVIGTSRRGVQTDDILKAITVIRVSSVMMSLLCVLALV